MVQTDVSAMIDKWFISGLPVVAQESKDHDPVVKQKTKLHPSYVYFSVVWIG